MSELKYTEEHEWLLIEGDRVTVGITDHAQEQLGEIVYDGPAEGLSPDDLTKIYGEEDWSATIRKVDDEDEAPDEDAIPEHHGPHAIRSDDVVSGM